MTTDDMKRHPGVHSRPRSSIWQWKIKAPVDLASLYPSPWAHRVSLGTADLREANAKAAALQAEWLARFDQQRRQLNPTKADRITPDMARLLADTLKRECLAVDERLRTNPKAWSVGGGTRVRLAGMPDALAESVQEVNAEQERLLSEAVARGNVGLVLAEVQETAAKLGIIFDVETPGAIEALQQCLVAVRDAYALQVKRDRGEVIQTPPAPAAKPRVAAAAEPARVLRDVFDRWKTSGEKPRTADNIAATERALRQFEAQYPDVKLADIDRDMGDKFRTLLRTTSKTSKTASDKLIAIKSLLKFAAETLRWLTENPWRGINLQYSTTNKRRPWTQGELETLFAAPLHQAYELPKDRKAGADAAYWIPLLALYSGARAGELCQLQTKDVQDVDGIPALHITDDGEGQKVKTAAGHRTIPIHSELIRLGFLEYADAQKKSGATSLWPALPMRAEKPSDCTSP